MNADDILTAARERLAEIDAQIATLTAERARLLRMTERETTPVKVPSAVLGDVGGIIGGTFTATTIALDDPDRHVVYPPGSGIARSSEMFYGGTVGRIDPDLRFG